MGRLDLHFNKCFSNKSKISSLAKYHPEDMKEVGFGLGGFVASLRRAVGPGFRGGGGAGVPAAGRGWVCVVGGRGFLDKKLN